MRIKASQPLSACWQWDKMNAEIDRIKQLEPKLPLPNKKKLN